MRSVWICHTSLGVAENKALWDVPQSPSVFTILVMNPPVDKDYLNALLCVVLMLKAENLSVPNSPPVQTAMKHVFDQDLSIHI